MTRILTIILLSIQCVFAVEFNIPENWTHKETPKEKPPSIRSIIQVVSPSEDAEVSLSEMDLVMSLDEAAESYVRGMAKKGFQHKTTFNVMHKGYEGKHITGELQLPGIENLIPVSAYIIFTQDRMISAGVVGAEAPSLIDQVLGWIEFPPAAVPLEPLVVKGDSGRSFWEYLGMVSVAGAVGYAISNSIYSRKKQDNKTV